MSRKPKGRDALRRRIGQRESSPRLLIVCEGEKTEPKYFRELRSLERLGTTEIEVVSDVDPNPRAILNRTKKLIKQSERLGNPIEKAFCVFDRDVHASFFEVVREIEKIRSRGSKVHAAYSEPCFEYWILLHFEYSRKPYRPIAGRGCSYEVIQDLQVHYPEYQKAQDGVYERTREQLDDAIERAKRSIAEAEEVAEPNPSTYVFALFEALRELSLIK